MKYISNPTNLPMSAEYLARSNDSTFSISSPTDWKEGAVQLRILEARAREVIRNLGKLVQKGIPWNDLNMDCVSVSRAHVEVFLLRAFLNTMFHVTEPSLHKPLTKLRNLVLCSCNPIDGSSHLMC